jgi:hypothetical protein
VKGPQVADLPQVGRADLRRATDSGLRPDAYRRGSYRLTPAAPGLRAPACRDRRPKPRALSGRGGQLVLEFPTSEKPATRSAVALGGKTARGLEKIFFDTRGATTS